MNEKSPRELWLETRVHVLERELKYLRQYNPDALKFTEFTEPTQIRTERPMNTITLNKVAGVSVDCNDIGYHVISSFIGSDRTNYTSSYHVSKKQLFVLDDSLRLNYLSQLHENTMYDFAETVFGNPTVLYR